MFTLTILSPSVTPHETTMRTRVETIGALNWYRVDTSILRAGEYLLQVHDAASRVVYDAGRPWPQARAVAPMEVPVEFLTQRCDAEPWMKARGETGDGFDIYRQVTSLGATTYRAAIGGRVFEVGWASVVECLSVDPALIDRVDPPLQVASAITVPSSFSVAVKLWWAAHCVNRTNW
jgi:hypothetical protein